MGYLSDRDLNKEFGFSRERPGRDYLGGRESRNLEARYFDREHRQREHEAQVAKQKEQDYLAQKANKEKLEALAREAQEMVNLVERQLRNEGNLGTGPSDVEATAKALAVKVARANAANYLVRWIGLANAKRLSGMGFRGNFLGIIFSPETCH